MGDVVLPRPVQAVIDAVNAADADAFAAMFAPDATVMDDGRLVSSGGGVGGWAAIEQIGAGARMRVVEAGTAGGITHVVFDWAMHGRTGRSEAFITIRGGLVTEFRIPPQ